MPKEPTAKGPHSDSEQAKAPGSAPLAVMITCKHEAVLLLRWLKRTRTRALCTSTNAFLTLCSEGLRDSVELFDAPLPGGRANEIAVMAERLARQVDADIASYLSEATGQQISQGWDFWDKLLFAKSLLPLAEWLRTNDLQSLPERLAICHFANAQDYLHPSLIRTQIISKALRQAGKRVARMPFESPFPPPHVSGIWRSSFRTSGCHLQGARLVHLPSTFYAQAELAALYGGEGFLALESPYYENPMHGRRIELDRGNPVSRGWPFDPEVPRRIYQTFAEALGFVEPEGMQLQVNHWLERLSFQFRAFKMLAMLRERYSVSLAALSDHDGGLFGPICSAFHGQQELVTVIPHSTIFVGPLPRLVSEVAGVMRSVRPLEPFDGALHPPQTILQGAPGTFDAGGAFVIVLNEIDDVSGRPVHRLDDLLDFVEALASALAARGLRPVLRARPSTPVRAVRSLQLEAWDGDLGELIAMTSLCVGVGQVTSAVSRFWSAGVRCLQVQDRELRVHDSYLLPAEGVACFTGKPFMESLSDVLAHIDQLLVDQQTQ